MHSMSISLNWKSGPHLRTDSVKLPSGFASFGWNNTFGPDLLADMAMIAFAVELGISYNFADGDILHHFIE